MKTEYNHNYYTSIAFLVQRRLRSACVSRACQLMWVTTSHGTGKRTHTITMISDGRAIKDQLGQHHRLDTAFAGQQLTILAIEGQVGAWQIYVDQKRLRFGDGGALNAPSRGALVQLCVSMY